jgi:ubiquinone/menaquinone biosynthesis C-methylase UbiE
LDVFFRASFKEIKHIGQNVTTDFVQVTEVAGDDVTEEQVERLLRRYYWAGQYCEGKDVVEAACGSGQGLGYLHGITRTLDAGDYSKKMIELTKSHYGDRIDLRHFNAQNMPFDDQSKDVIILFEAIYYLPDAKQFVKECARVLRPEGVVLLSTANKDLFDFNPSPHSYTYYGTVELNSLFSAEGFSVKCFGDTPVNSISIRQITLRPIKKLAVFMNLVPKNKSNKIWLKRIVFGNLVKMPYEIPKIPNPHVPIMPLDITSPDIVHKVIFCEATLSNSFI